MCLDCADDDGRMSVHVWNRHRCAVRREHLSRHVQPVLARDAGMLSATILACLAVNDL